MKIKELHQDVERYLTHDCYCPNEVYSFDGFGYMLIKPEDECLSLGTLKDTEAQENYVISIWNDKTSNAQVVIFFIREKDNVCCDAIRFDATENNLKIINSWFEGKKIIKHNNFDEYIPGRTLKEIKNILSCCSAIMIN